MGNIPGCSSKGAILLVASANGDVAVASEVCRGQQLSTSRAGARPCALKKRLRSHPSFALQILKHNPGASTYHYYKDRSSPLILSSGGGRERQPSPLN
jgi:hypothetical protein